MRTIITAITIFLLSLDGFAQQLPIGDCGIVYIHDAAGNRTRRIYFCNNGNDPYPTGTVPVVPAAVSPSLSQTSREEILAKEAANFEVLAVDVLYPNPTSGVFTITFRNVLNDAIITVVDSNGKTVKKSITNGINFSCDLSALSAGNYFIRIQQGKQIITKKLVKI